MIASLVLAWLGGASTFTGPMDAPRISARAAVLMDPSTGRVLWSKNGDLPLYPASTTKIATALLVMKKVEDGTLSLNQRLRAGEKVKEIGGSSLYMEPGEVVNVGDLLAGLMLRSANDGAETLAIAASGSVEAFATEMTELARSTGCENTTFKNPHGLHESDHITTAHDLARLAGYASKFQQLTELTRKTSVTIDRSIRKENVLLKNRMDLVVEDPRFIGLKTGYTNPAGKCFVGLTEKDGVRFVTVVMRSEDWIKDSQALADWGYATWKSRESEGIALSGVAQVSNGHRKTARISANVQTSSPLSDEDVKSLELKFRQPLRAPIISQARVGFGTAKLPDGTTFEAIVFAGETVEEQPSNFTGLGLVVLAGAFGLTYWMRKRARRGLM
ncbi:MAG: D-alanyl-D-alanine carboxypeptidase [Armatimonadetes bacterium]|nr:D-alanyl-D-alanine carboxypeptidase [Armatimonadota bacterium]